MKYLLTAVVVLFSLGLKAQTSEPAGLKVGDTAPMFNGIDMNGKTFSLESALKKGDVVLMFYRGQWCPYCNKQMSQMNDSLSMITGKGATVVAISPEIQENVVKTVEKTKASFPVISDVQMKIMKDYQVNFAVPQATIDRYKNFGIDFNVVNGGNGANLPVPATYVIGKNGKIKYVFFNPDYRKRASVKEIASYL
ncbi:peroxiredoxin-like family protein [Sediminibacterium sp.]|jgi:peroxiredoxin|uniref:peroxiredoxin-like family protein n=1 Tax=Sediminibacterium sp. TaxID=1917865 RepID=UPI0025E7833B|nr:peroxiredoxin-like family protein [Sediminibacterium sp.]MBW0178540.1 AhpC/TSA family protein [Sediminibacterium sp.]